MNRRQMIAGGLATLAAPFVPAVASGKTIPKDIAILHELFGIEELVEEQDWPTKSEMVFISQPDKDINGESVKIWRIDIFKNIKRGDVISRYTTEYEQEAFGNSYRTEDGKWAVLVYKRRLEL